MCHKFDVNRFRHLLQTSWLGSEFVYIEKTDSTNSYLKQIPSAELAHGAVALADYQSKGRGQYDRKWESEPYKNLTFTVAFRPKSGSRLNLLSLAMAYSAASTLETYIAEPVHLKWPNDIIVRGKKMGGLLTECTFNGSKPDRVLIGLGLNIRNQKFSSEVADLAISFQEVSESDISREELLNEILLGFENIYQKWHKQDEKLRQMISKKLLGYGEWVRISINDIIPNQKFKLVGVNQKGELMMLNEQLDVNTFTYEQVRIITGNQGISATETSSSI